MIDSIDRTLLALLQSDARTGYQDLGEAVGLSGPAAYQRVRKLEEAAVLVGYHASVNPVAVGRPVLAFLRVAPAPATDVRRLEERWRTMPEVAECHRLTGPDGYLVKLRLGEIAELEGHLEALRRTGCAVAAEIAVSTAIERSAVPLA